MLHLQASFEVVCLEAIAGPGQLAPRVSYQDKDIQMLDMLTQVSAWPRLMQAKHCLALHEPIPAVDKCMPSGLSHAARWELSPHRASMSRLQLALADCR